MFAHHHPLIYSKGVVDGLANARGSMEDFVLVLELDQGGDVIEATLIWVEESGEYLLAEVWGVLLGLFYLKVSGWSSFIHLAQLQLVRPSSCKWYLCYFFPCIFVAPWLLFFEDFSIIRWFLDQMLFSLRVACFRWCIPYLQ